MTFILIPFFEYEIALSTPHCSDLSPRLTDINSLKYFHEYFMNIFCVFTLSLVILKDQKKECPKPRGHNCTNDKNAL